MSLSYSEIQRIKGIARCFKIADGEITHVLQVNSGRINSSYKITVTQATGAQENETISYMLQKINNNVFPNVDAVMKNAILVTNHLRKKGMETLEYLKVRDEEESGQGEDSDTVETLDDKSLLLTLSDGYYRMTKFIHAEIFQNITRREDMVNLGFAVAEFANGLSDFDASLLEDTIPDFHNTRVRYENLLFSAFRNASDYLQNLSVYRKKNMECRVEKARQEVSFVSTFRDKFGIIVDAINCGSIPLRVTHNDTKLNNVLFDRKTNKPRCLIDLDTVMSGSILYDIADSIRSGANTKSEDSQDGLDIHIDLELAKAFLTGFREGAPEMLTKEEIKLLPVAIQLMPLELCMRFLTDYFDGDIYFGIVNKDDNLSRAKVQFALAKDINKNMEKVIQIVREVFE